MKKRILSLVTSVAILCGIFVISDTSVQASENEIKKVDGSYLTMEEHSEGHSSDSLTRGIHMMDGECSISKAGRDEIYCYGSTTANHVVDRLIVIVYVEQYQEDLDEWWQVDSWVEEAKKRGLLNLRTTPDALPYFIKEDNIELFKRHKVFDEEGTLCAIATSKWCLLDTTTGKIAKLPENIAEIYHGFHDESVFGIEDVPKLEEPKLEPLNVDSYKIRRFDLDLNKHVHNLNYLNIAYELLPEDVYDGSELNNVEILYKRELKYGDIVKSYLYKQDNSYIIVLKSEDNTILHSIIKLF